MSGEDLRRKTMTELCQQLEFVGSCEPTGSKIAKMCWKLTQEIVAVAKAEGWDADPPLSTDTNETT